MKEYFNVQLILPYPPNIPKKAMARIWRYRALVYAAVTEQWPKDLFRPLNQHLALQIFIHPNNHQKSSIMTIAIQVIDCLKADPQFSTRPRAAVYLDDSQIDHFSVTRGSVTLGAAYVTVRLTPWP